MFQNLPLFPEQASTMAPRVDALLYFLTAVSIFFASLIFIFIVVFAVKYRRRSDAEKAPQIEGSIPLEIFWSVVPLGITMVMFIWGALVYFDMSSPPAGALEINLVGRQWMWKAQHAEGQSEINELHVPAGLPVRLTMTSEDVIHSYFVPAFRIKMDVLPARYTTIWFHPTKAGEYRLFCAEYCGTLHSGMIGRVVVMEPADYQRWLGEGATGTSMAEAGAELFRRLGCGVCHRASDTGQGPALAGLFGKSVKLEGGGSALADEGYIRESILEPHAKVVAGFPPVMPTFKGLVSEDGILQIIAYLKSLRKEERARAER
ncbi:MAG TPA: cytochrome c oxidase subunit II [Candidatus Binatia bacterium]|jgi:cytochrome c oxidase subunit 2